MEKLTSLKNPTIKALRDLREKKTRIETGMFLVEGEVMIREALKCGLTMHELLAEEAQASLAEALMGSASARAYLAPRSVLESVCETRTPQGICASFFMPKPLELDDVPDVVVALDGVQDPGNVGTIWRTADAAGFQALMLGDGCADPFSPKTQRAAMGSGFRVPVVFASPLKDGLNTLKARGYCILASKLDGCDFYRRPDCGRKLALVVGNEARGISEAVSDCADVLVRLPMRGGAESLNAAVAAGIMMYDLMKDYE